MLRKCLKVFLCLLLAVSLVACSNETTEVSNDQFDTWCNELIVRLVGTDNTSFNQMILHPEKLGIEKTTISWPSYSLDEGREFNELANTVYSELQNFAYDSLSIDQKETYDVLNWALEPTPDEYVDSFYYLSNNPLGTYTGILGDIPLVFFYFNINDQKDVENYINLIETLPKLANNLLTFEVERQKAGYGMTPIEVMTSLSDIDQTLEVGDYSFLIDSFIEKINATDLEEITKKAYITQVESDLQGAIISFYETLREGLANIEILQEDNISLFDLKNGKEYYEYLVYSYTGIEDMDEYYAYVESLLQENVREYLSLYSQELDASVPIYDSDDPNEVIAYLKEAMKEDFPEVGDVDYEMIIAPDALVSLMGSTTAFYVIAPLDDLEAKQEMTLVSDYTDTSFLTIAHEGYPGHLYQHYYDNSQNNTAYIVNFLGLTGYTEGYANYVERYSAKYAQNPDMALAYKTLENYSCLTLLLCDYKMHYEGEDIREDLATIYGVSSDSLLIEPVVRQLQFAPGIFIPYYVSGFMFDDLHETLNEEVGYEVSDLDFHTAILSHGPMPLNLLEEYVLNDFSLE